MAGLSEGRGNQSIDQSAGGNESCVTVSVCVYVCVSVCVEDLYASRPHW